MTGSYQYPESVPPQQYPEQIPSAYPGMLPPPVPYPKRRRWPKVLAAVLVVAVLAGVAAVVVQVIRSSSSEPGVVTETQAKDAIQEYLSALIDADDQTVAKHTMCGLFDAVRDRKTDLAVASLAGDTFRKQFSDVEVTSIDKIVPWSTTQAQVLFTMQVAPASGSLRGQRAPTGEQQGVAQLLVDKTDGADDVLVCSYVLRTGGQY